MDKEHLDYILKEVNEHRGTPFQMANEEIANEMFPYIQMAFPNAQMVKQGIAQYITVSTRAKNVLIKQMELHKAHHLKEVDVIDHILSELKRRSPSLRQ